MILAAHRRGRRRIAVAALVAAILGLSAPASADDGLLTRRLPAAASSPIPTPTRIALGDMEVQFTWPSVPGATAYRIRLTGYGKVVREQTWQHTNIFIDGLDPESAYEFSVAAVSASDIGPFSKPSAFVTPFDFVERQFGSDRYATAARVSFRMFPFHGIGTAFVASGLDFPDALSAAAGAARLRAPVLLAEPWALPAPTRKEISALRPARSFVTGGSGAISDHTLQLISALTSQSASRLAGADRYETGAAVSTLWPTAPVVYLANGSDFPDALAGAAAAGAQGAPVLLARPDGLPDATAAALARLRPARILVLGGEAVLSSAVAEQATLATGVPTQVARLAGPSRYDTAVAVSKSAFPKPGVPVVYVASGASFPDALAGAAAAGQRGGPVLLTPQNALPSGVLAEIRRLNPKRVIVLGGPSVVGDQAIAQLLEIAP